jgi:hypothetical protein
MFGKNLFRCVVEDNKDPEYLGRVKIRVLGVQSAYQMDVKTEELPWSNVLQSPDRTNILGTSTSIPIGTWGYCLALDDAFTEFLYLGSIRGKIPKPDKKDPSNNFVGFRSFHIDPPVYLPKEEDIVLVPFDPCYPYNPDPEAPPVELPDLYPVDPCERLEIDEEVYEDEEEYPNGSEGVEYYFPREPEAPCNPMEIPGEHKTKYTPIVIDAGPVMEGEQVFEEPEDTNENVEYPYNKVYEDMNGNVIEIDGSKYNPRIKVTHASGSRLSINCQGDISVQGGENGNIYVETPGFLGVKAASNMAIECDVRINGNLDVTGNIIGLDVCVTGLHSLTELGEHYKLHIEQYNLHVTNEHGANPAYLSVRYDGLEWGPFYWKGGPVTYPMADASTLPKNMTTNPDESYL